MCECCQWCVVIVIVDMIVVVIVIVAVVPPLPTNYRASDLWPTGPHHPDCQALQQIRRDPLPQKRSQLRGTAVAEATGKNR